MNDSSSPRVPCARVVRRALPVLCGLLLGGAATTTAATAGATIVERVVAVVGESAILLSELRERARPFLLRAEQQGEDEAVHAAKTSQLYTQLLDHMVDEELEQKAANRANVSVTEHEIDDALARVASQNGGLTVQQVIEEAEHSGLSERNYRLELRRQLLEAKLMNLRILGRLRITDDDVAAAYQKLVVEERRQLDFRAAWIRISAPRSLPPDALRDRRAVADAVYARARRGEDFAELARKYSDDRATRASGGLLGELHPGDLSPELESVTELLDVGDVSEPIRQGEDFVILKIVERAESKLPAFQDAKSELRERVYMDKMNQARKRWLEGLRRQTHVEIRL